MNYAMGSIWRKWDLHVHTPASLAHRFQPGAATDPWDAYIKALAQLPSEFKVIGINDYLFIEGYRRVREAHQSGQLRRERGFQPSVVVSLERRVMRDLTQHSR